MQYIDNIPVWGTHEENTLEQARVCARSADYVALMADGHLGYGVPIGGIIATENRISPTAVGFDITITTTLRDWKSTTAGNCGSAVRERRRPSPASEASSVERWARSR